MPAPRLVTIPGVELLRTGTFDLALGGTQTFTREDLASAVAAASDFRAPTVHLGHTDPRFDGDPALGRVVNLRLAEGGDVLVGDLVDVPEQFAMVMNQAYPSRSIEGLRNAVAASGSQHRFALTGLALLGATRPAVENLRDVMSMYGLAASEGRGDAVLAVVQEPLYAARAPVYELPPRPHHPTPTPQEGPDVDLIANLREALGLPDDTPDEQVQVAVLDRLTAPAPEPVVEVPAEVAAAAAAAPALRAEITRLATEVQQLQASAAQRDRASFFDQAISEGRIAPADRAHYEGLWDLDRNLVQTLVMARAAGSSVPLGEKGHGADPQISDDEAFYQSWRNGATYTTEMKGA